MKKSIFTLFIALVALCMSNAAQSQTYYPSNDPWGNANYDSSKMRYLLYSDGHAEVAGAKYDIEDVTIPATIAVNGKTYAVTAICEKAFQSRGKISTITIEGENLKTIGKNAFQYAGCNSKGIDMVLFPGSLYDIYEDAFNTSKIRHIRFENDAEGNSHLNIHTNAFYGCQQLSIVELYCSVVGKGAFRECQYIKTVALGKNVERIGERAFENCQRLETIIVGGQVPPVCEKDAFKGAGYEHRYGMTQIEDKGYDENGVFHGSEEALKLAAQRAKEWYKDPSEVNVYGNFLHYVKVKLATDDYENVYAQYKNYAPIPYTENGVTRYSYQGWQKDRTNQYYIEFKPNEVTGKNDGWTADQNQLNGFGGDPWQRLSANFYYSPFSDEELKQAVETKVITVPMQFELEQVAPTLALSAVGKAVYTAGSFDEPGEYVDGSNSCTSAVAPVVVEDNSKVRITNGSTLTIYRYAANGDSVAVKTATETKGTGDKLSSLIAALGECKDVIGAEGATYKMVLSIAGGETYVSEPATVLSFAQPVKTAAVEMFRSGTPDANTCATEEAYSNAITIPVEDAPAGYYIYRDGEVVATLAKQADGTYTDENGAEYGSEEIVYTDNAAAAPIAVGENTNTSERAAKIWNYEVVSFDENGNTCGGGTLNTEFTGNAGELAVTTTEKTTIGYSYAQIASNTSLSWTLDESVNSDDIIGYEIYRSVDGGKFTKVADTNSTEYTDTYVYARQNLTSSAPSAGEYAAINYYVKAITSTSNDVPQNLREKNSNVVAVTVSQGSVFTGIEGVDAEGATVKVANGIITVNGVNGSIEVYSTNGTMVAKANSNGGETEIDATVLSAGIYVVKTANNSTKILIK